MEYIKVNQVDFLRIRLLEALSAVKKREKSNRREMQKQVYK